MKAKSLMIVALAAFCCLGTQARSKKKSTVKPVVAAAADVKPVPADSFSYAMGVAQGQSLKQYIVQREGVDTTYMAEFIKGLNAQVSEAEVKKQVAYTAGLRIQQMNREQVLPQVNKQVTGKADTTFLQLDKLNEGLTQVLNGQKGALTQEEALKLLERQSEYFMNTLKMANADYLTKNAKNKGVKTEKNGLQYKVLTKGNGALPTDTAEVEVNYEGRLIDGTVFDSSYKRGKAATFKVNQVIKGWQQALKMMPVGSTWELYIPYDLAYGERGTRDIPPYSTLIFKVELLGIKDAKAAEAKTAEPVGAAQTK